MVGKPKPNEFQLSDLTVGQSFSFKRLISWDDVLRFAELSGDYNPLHVEPNFAALNPWGRNIVHGQLLASLFSQLVGMHCPGLRCLYLRQTTHFKNPVFPGDSVDVVGTIKSIHESVQIVTLKTQILKENTVCVDGEAQAQFI